jgi:hypothetical protein
MFVTEFGWRDGQNYSSLADVCTLRRTPHLRVQIHKASERGILFSIIYLLILSCNLTYIMTRLRVGRSTVQFPAGEGYFLLSKSAKTRLGFPYLPTKWLTRHFSVYKTARA